MCVYLTPDGLKCAIGCLIPNELYTAEIEGASVSNNTALEKILESIGIGFDHYTLLCKLQKIHDRIEVHEWECALRQLAKSEDLLWQYQSPYFW